MEEMEVLLRPTMMVQELAEDFKTLKRNEFPVGMGNKNLNVKRVNQVEEGKKRLSQSLGGKGRYGSWGKGVYLTFAKRKKALCQKTTEKRTVPRRGTPEVKNGSWRGGRGHKGLGERY